ncbi:DUF397 domain-containing protein [Spirillospora sp. NPDC047418]
MHVSQASWRKSSRSHVGGNDCVEVGGASDGVLIRDSKDAVGPLHKLTPAAFGELVSRIKSGRLDL